MWREEPRTNFFFILKAQIRDFLLRKEQSHSRYHFNDHITIIVNELVRHNNSTELNSSYYHYGALDSKLVMYHVDAMRTCNIVLS